MYKYNFNVAIFSNSHDLEKILESTDYINTIKFNYSTFLRLNKLVLARNNVVIVDLRVFPDFDIKDVGDNTRVIYITDKYDKSMEDADDVFVMPMSDDEIRYRFKKFYQQLDLEEQLSFTKQCFETTINSLDDMYWIKTLDGIHMVLNDTFCKTLKRDKDDITGKSHAYIWNVPEDDPGIDVCRKSEEEVVESGGIVKSHETVSFSGGDRQLVTTKAPLYDKFGKAIGTVGFGHDITDIKNLSIENQILLDSIPYPVLIRDINGNIININKSFEAYFGYTLSNLDGISYDVWKEKAFIGERTINVDGFTEATFISKDGSKKNVELRVETIQDLFGNTTGEICAFRDVTIQRRMEEKIIETSNIDFLTKAYNRRYLSTYVESLKDGDNVLLISLDLDHFKALNDSYGHDAGDEAIVLTANILKGIFGDGIVVRMGGDEFLGIKKGEISENEIKDLCEYIIYSLKRAFSDRKEFEKLSASVGVTYEVYKKGKFDDILKDSDKALYIAKENGRDGYHIMEEQYPKMRARTIQTSE